MAFVFAPLARTIGASDHKEASCLRDRAKDFVCKMGVAWRPPMAMVGCGGVRSARGASGERRSASRSSERAAGSGQADLFGARVAGVFVSDWRRVVARRVDRKRRHRQRRRREHERRRREQRRQRRRLQHDDGESWGSAAANAAGVMGVSATAPQRRVSMESNCQNVGASGGGTASGAFQMINRPTPRTSMAPWHMTPQFQEASCRVLLGRWTRRRRLMRRRTSCERCAWRLESSISDPTVLTRAMYQSARALDPVSQPPTISAISQSYQV